MCFLSILQDTNPIFMSLFILSLSAVQLFEWFLLFNLGLGAFLFWILISFVSGVIGVGFYALVFPIIPWFIVDFFFVLGGPFGAIGQLSSTFAQLSKLK